MSSLPRILLVDDNESDRELAALVLSGEFDRVEIEKVRSATEFSAAMATGLFGLVITEAELDERPELVRTMSVQPPRGAGDIRTVRISGVDFQPCGGTHVSNTSEIGAVRISKIENKGKRNRRVHLLLE